MPSNFLTADTAFPWMNGEQSVSEKLEAIENYLFMLLEQLRYTLANLGAENFNSAELDSMTKVITDPIFARIEDAQGNIARLSLTAEGLSVQISNEVTQRETAIRQTSEEIALVARNSSAGIAALSVRADGIEASVQSAQGNIATLQQTAGSISGTVSDLQTGMGHTLRLAADGATVTDAQGRRVIISNGNLNLTGAITFTDLTSGFQANINSISITADRAADIAKKIANGSYSNGSFINKNEIYGPTIYANNLEIFPETRDSSGSFNLYGYYGGRLYHMLRIRYYEGIANPEIVIESPARASIGIYGNIRFSGNVDFSSANVTGL